MPMPSATSRNFPTLRHVVTPFRWLFGNRRRVKTAAAVVFSMIAAPVFWWFIQLAGLPDIGDPFDLAEYRSRSIPDDQNAYVLYAEAEKKLGLKVSTRTGIPANHSPWDPSEVRWSKVSPDARAWAEANREAMELFRLASERPDALAAGPRADVARYLAFRAFLWLAELEASRLEEQGDMAGAWIWYRAVLRASYLFGRSGDLDFRLLSGPIQAVLRIQIENWAVDPRTTRVMVQKALDDVVACGPLATPRVESLRGYYLRLMEELDGPRNPGRFFALAGLQSRLAGLWLILPPDQRKSLTEAWRTWRAEPERSRRVLRLAMANWLAYYSLPPDGRPDPDPTLPGPVRFYDFGPEAPASARALSARNLHRWFDSTTDARALLMTVNPAILSSQEARTYRELVVQVACELYRRDRGKIPIQDEELVGTYLKKLPDDGLGGPGVISGRGMPLPIPPRRVPRVRKVAP